MRLHVSTYFWAFLRDNVSFREINISLCVFVYKYCLIESSTIHELNSQIKYNAHQIRFAACMAYVVACSRRRFRLGKLESLDRLSDNACGCCRVTLNRYVSLVIGLYSRQRLGKPWIAITHAKRSGFRLTWIRIRDPYSCSPWSNNLHAVTALFALSPTNSVIMAPLFSSFIRLGIFSFASGMPYALSLE